MPCSSICKREKPILRDEFLIGGERRYCPHQLIDSRSYVDLELVQKHPYPHQAYPRLRWFAAALVPVTDQQKPVGSGSDGRFGGIDEVLAISLPPARLALPLGNRTVCGVTLRRSSNC